MVKLPTRREASRVNYEPSLWHSGAFRIVFALEDVVIPNEMKSHVRHPVFHLILGDPVFGKVLAVNIWPGLLDYINEKARKENVTNLETILAKLDDPNLPKNQVDVAFFHDVLHNMNDRQAYLEVLASYLKPSGRVAIIHVMKNIMKKGYIHLIFRQVRII